MLITNPSHQTIQTTPTPPTTTTDSNTDRPTVIPIDQLTLHGKVETEISISLGCLQVGVSV